VEDVSPLSLHPWRQSFAADADVSADASEAHVRLVSQCWPTAVPTRRPVPVLSCDLLLLLLSSYEFCASHENVLILLILSALAYTANPISEPTCTIPLKSQALPAVGR